MALWSDGDALTPDAMNAPQMSEVTINRTLSLSSLTVTIPSLTSSTGFFHVSLNGACYWVGGSGTSTLVGGA